jgi:tetratricopeptide (TPR) repeat protein
VHLAPVYAPPVMDKALVWAQIFLPLAGCVMAWVSFNAQMRKWLVFALVFYFLSTFFLWRFDIKDFNPVADRFMYLPSLGFCIGIGLLISGWFERARSWRGRSVFGAVIILGAGLMTFRTYEQTGVWDNSFHFWSNVIKERPAFPFALKPRIQASLEMDLVFNAGGDEHIKKSVDKRYWQFIEKQPGGKEVAAKKIFYLRRLWALRDIRVLARDKDYKGDCYYFSALAHEDLGKSRIGGNDREYNAYSRAIDLNRNDPALFFGRGVLGLKMGRVQRAFLDAMKAVKLDPADPRHYDLAVFCAVSVRKYDLAKKLLDVGAALFPQKSSVALDRSKIDSLLGQEKGPLK